MLHAQNILIKQWFSWIFINNLSPRFPKFSKTSFWESSILSSFLTKNEVRQNLPRSSEPPESQSRCGRTSTRSERLTSILAGKERLLLREAWGRFSTSIERSTDPSPGSGPAGSGPCQSSSSVELKNSFKFKLNKDYFKFKASPRSP